MDTQELKLVEQYDPTNDVIVHETSVDFVLRPCFKEIHVVQYDKSLPVVKVDLYKEGEKFTLPANASVNIRFGKRDRTFVVKAVLGCNEARDAIYFDVDEQMTALEGRLSPTLEMIIPTERNGETIPTVANSSPIQFVIDRNPVQNGYIESHSDYPIVYTLMADVANHEERISELESQVSGDYYNKSETDALLNGKADKKGPLPSYVVELTDNVLTFINSNNVDDKPIIVKLSVQSRYDFIGTIRKESSSSNYGRFEFEVLGSTERYAFSNPLNLTDLTFNDIFSSTFRADYALKSYVDSQDDLNEKLANKKTTLTDSDTDYPTTGAVKSAIKTISYKQAQLYGGTYPRLLKYNESKLYLFLDNCYRVSTDNGKTWSDPVVLFTASTETQESGQTINDVGNAYAFLSPNNDGRIVVLYRSLNRDTPYFSICAKVSDTNGENFGVRQELFHSQAGYWEPFYYGDYIYYSAEHGGSGADKAQSIYRRWLLNISSSGHINIGSSQLFIDGRNKVDTDGNVNNKSRIGMISASPVEDGHIYVFESSVNINASTPRPMVVQYCYLRYPGNPPAELTSVKNLFLGSSGKKCGAPFVATLDDGRIAISFQTNEKYTGYSRTDFRDSQFLVFISKRKVAYGDELTSDDFVKLTTYEYGENEYGVWGSLANIDGFLYKAFSIGTNTSTTTQTAYGTLVQQDFQYDYPKLWSKYKDS